MGSGGISGSMQAMHAMGLQWIVFALAIAILVAVLWFFETH